MKSLVVPVIVFLVALAASLSAFFLLRRQEVSTQVAYIATQCVRRKNLTLLETNGGTTVLLAMHEVSVLYDASRWIPFAEDMLLNTQWKIIGVALLQQMTGPEFQAWALQQNIEPTERKPDGTTGVATTFDRPFYLPIVQDFPDAASIGYDYYSDASRSRLVLQAISRGNLTLSDPTRPVNGSMDDTTIVFFIPSFDDEGRFVGGVSAGYRTRSLIPSTSFNDNVLVSLTIDGILAYEDASYDATDVRDQQVVQLADKQAQVNCGLVLVRSTTSTIILVVGAIVGLILGALAVWVIHLIRRQRQTLVEQLRLAEDKRLANVARESALDSLKIKSDFLASVSHEVRTPVNGIMWMANFLLGTPLSDEQLEYARNLQTTSQSLLQIVNDVLDFSKMEAGKLRLEKIPCDINALLEQVLIQNRNQARDLNDTLTVESTLAPSEGWVRTDPTRVNQVLTNLVGNAIKFTRNGKVTIRCSRVGALIEFHVVDEGIGITQENVARLFEPYTQADISTTRRFGGTGLGLSICKQLTELLGGSIACRSEIGKGSDFFFAIPWEPCPAPASALVREASGVQFRGHVLVVDDNLINRKVLRKLLSDLGLTHEDAVNGEEAVTRALDPSLQKLDVILLDLFMPVMDGYQATAAIRAKGCIVPIVCVTANALLGERERCIALGMNAFLTKPIIKADLIAVLRTYCKPL